MPFASFVHGANWPFPALETIVTNLIEDVEHAVKMAASAQRSAAEAVRQHTQQVKEAMDLREVGMMSRQVTKVPDVTNVQTDFGSTAWTYVALATHQARVCCMHLCSQTQGKEQQWEATAASNRARTSAIGSAEQAAQTARSYSSHYCTDSKYCGFWEK